MSNDTNVSDDNKQQIVLNQFDQRDIIIYAYDASGTLDRSADTWLLTIADLRENSPAESSVTLLAGSTLWTGTCTKVIFLAGSMTEVVLNERKSSGYEVWDTTRGELFNHGNFIIKKRIGYGG